MNKHNIYINPVAYKKIHKKLLKYNIKIGGMNIMNFLIANSSIQDSANSPTLRTKRVILHISGNLDSKPEDLANESHLRQNLLFGHIEYLLLRRRLDQLTKEYVKGTKISIKEVQDCQVVGDCIDLVNSKIYNVNRD